MTIGDTMITIEILAALSSRPTEKTEVDPDIEQAAKNVVVQEIATEIKNVSVTETGIETGAKIEIAIVRETPTERGTIIGQSIETHTHAPIGTAMKEANLGLGLNGLNELNELNG